MNVLRFQCIFVLLAFSSSALPISNMIVFGDSLSDMGNFPEAKTIEDPYWGGISQHYYIPPVNPENDKKSTNWVQMLHELYLGRDAGTRLIPHIQMGYETKTYDLTTSINYAWWAAVVTPGCYNDNYQLQQLDCHFSEIFDHQNKVRNAASIKDVNYQQILIPGLPTQVDLFLSDVNSGRVSVNQDTLYILLIGGNELYHSQSLFNDNPLAHLKEVLDLATGGGVDYIESSILKIHQELPTAMHFLVFTLYNLKYTPHVINDALKSKLANLYTTQFNTGIKKIAQKIHSKKGLTLTVFDLESFFTSLAESSFFKSSLGFQCDQQDAMSLYYVRDIMHGDCTLDQAHGILFWNNSHPSALVHQALSKAVYDELVHQDNS